MTDMTPADMDVLEALAHAVTDPLTFHVRFPTSGTMTAAERNLIAALSPDVVLRLIAAARQPKPAREAALREALTSAEQDVLWALGAFTRLGWPASIADLFERHGQPHLVAEYQQVQANIAARATLAALPPSPELLDVDGLPFCPSGYAQRYHAIGQCSCSTEPSR